MTISHKNHRPPTPPDPNTNISKAKSYLMCTEAVLLDIKTINVSSQTAELEIIVAINSFETFLNKAKSLLNVEIK
jgi:hypothetical protein